MLFISVWLFAAKIQPMKSFLMAFQIQTSSLSETFFPYLFYPDPFSFDPFRPRIGRLLHLHHVIDTRYPASQLGNLLAALKQRRYTYET